MTVGVLYLLKGREPCLPECLKSVASLRAIHPDLPVALVTDVSLCDDEKAYFNHIIRLEVDEHPFKSKIRALGLSPFDRTLYLDTDTQVVQSLTPLFSSLENYDLGVAPAPDVFWGGRVPRFLSFEADHVFNMGVILFRKCEVIDRLLSKWLDALDKVDREAIQAGHDDQWYFNVLFGGFCATHPIKHLRLSSLRYNARTFLANHIERYGLTRSVAIWHGRRDYVV